MIARLLINPWTLGALVAALGLAAVEIDRRAYDRGQAAAEADAAAAAEALERKLSARDRALRAALADLQAVRRSRAAEIERLEHDAIEDPGADRPALPAGSLRRLRSRWGAD